MPFEEICLQSEHKQYYIVEVHRLVEVNPNILVRDVKRMSVINIFLQPVPVQGRQPAAKFQVPNSNGLGGMTFSRSVGKG